MIRMKLFLLHGCTQNKHSLMRGKKESEGEEKCNGWQWMPIIYVTQCYWEIFIREATTCGLVWRAWLYIPVCKMVLASPVELVSHLVWVSYIQQCPGLYNKLCSSCEYRRKIKKCFLGFVNSTQSVIYLIPEPPLMFVGPIRGPHVPRPFSSCPESTMQLGKPYRNVCRQASLLTQVLFTSIAQ